MIVKIVEDIIEKKPTNKVMHEKEEKNKRNF